MNSISLPAITRQDFSLIEGQPRVLDLRLAQALGFERPRNIRKLIQRHIKPLVEAGGGALHMERPPTGEVTGINAYQYHLTLDQALYLCAKAGTERAARITLDMVRVYRAISLDMAVPYSETTEQLLSPCAKAALRYARMGLRSGEIGKLLGLQKTATRDLLRKLRLARLLPTGREVAHG